MASRARRRKLGERAMTDPMFREGVRVRDMARHIAYGRINRQQRRAALAGTADSDFFIKLRQSWRQIQEATR